MEKKQIKAKYIVVKQPDDNIAYRNVIKFLYIVITREELSKKIDNYLNGKIERTAGVYAPLDLFNHIIKHRKVYSYEEAKRRAPVSYTHLTLPIIVNVILNGIVEKVANDLMSHCFTMVIVLSYL